VDRISKTQCIVLKATSRSLTLALAPGRMVDSTNRQNRASDNSRIHISLHCGPMILLVRVGFHSYLARTEQWSLWVVQAGLCSDQPAGDGGEIRKKKCGAHVESGFACVHTVRRFVYNLTSTWQSHLANKRTMHRRPNISPCRGRRTPCAP